MEAALDLEDDVFFADLSKQISLLIMDDDEDSLVHCPSVNLQAFSQAINPAAHASYLNYDHQQTCKRESKGTGVFIPCSTNNPRRKNAKQGRFAANGNKFQRPSDHNNSKGIIPQIAYHNNNNISTPSYDAFNLRRF